MSYVGFVVLPSSLIIGTDSLGAEFTGEVAGVDIAILFPRLDFETRSLIGPTDDLLGDAKSMLPKGWGTVWDNYYEIRGAGLSVSDFDVVMDSETYREKTRAAAAEDDADDGDEPWSAPDFARSFCDWFENVRSWLAAWTDVNKLWPGTSTACTFVLEYDDGYHSKRSQFDHVGVHYVRATTPSRSQVQAAFDRASRGEGVPVEYRLVLNADNARTADDYRTAIIDATTAIEIALANAISAELRAYGAPQEFISEIILQANGISGLVKLYSSQGGDLPVSRSRLGEEVARLRNLAAHAGHHPNEMQVRTALEHAKKMVRSIAPLSAV